MNKRVALLLFLALLLHARAFAAVRSGDWAYDVLEDGTASIAGYLGYSGTVAIPEEIDGYPVSQIGDDVFAFGNTLEDVTIPGCVRRIGAGAFVNMEKLRRVTLGEGVETVGALAFNLCAKLEEIVLPDSVTELASGAFSYCERLARVQLGAGLVRLGDNPFEGDAAVCELTVSPENPALRADGAFLLSGDRLVGCFPAAGDPAGDALTVPDGVREIGPHVLSFRHDVRRVTLPEGVETIDAYAFTDCNSLEEISLPASLRQIGEAAFSGCDSLAEATLPDGLERIGSEAFVYCPKLLALTIPASVTQLGSDGGELPVFDAGIRLIVTPGSVAEAYALKKRLTVEYKD